MICFLTNHCILTHFFLSIRNSDWRWIKELASKIQQLGRECDDTILLAYIQCVALACTPFSMDISSIRLQIVDKTQPARTITAIIQDEGFSLCEMGADFKELIETM